MKGREHVYLSELMFEITDSAAKQFIASANTIGDKNLSLRVSARKSALGAKMDYNLGFDNPNDDDEKLKINGIEVIVDPDSINNIKSMIIDFREFEGVDQFVFINPNDKKDACESSPGGCDPEGNSTCKSCMDE
jgi:iron-sulfur cluster assembly protein